VLVIHDDGDVLDLMTRLFEASRFDVVTAVTGFRAQAHLEGDRPIDVVIAPWDTTHRVGGDVYRWVLQTRYDLRDQFIFIASEVPAEFDKLVAGRCLALSMQRPAEIVRVAIAAVKRREALERAREVGVGERDREKPSLLLADDDPVLLMVMAGLLEEGGYAVTRADSGGGAIAQLTNADFDALVVDWQMEDGNGANIVRWLREYKPWLADRLVFLSNKEPDISLAAARPVFRKGQDSGQLTHVLREIVRQSKA
jgi:CheY-like chemotaxis protein